MIKQACKILYVNCPDEGNTEYKLIHTLAIRLGSNFPSKGRALDEVYDEFFKQLDKRHNEIIMVILDQTEQIDKNVSAHVIYNLTMAGNEIRNVQLIPIDLNNHKVPSVLKSVHSCYAPKLKVFKN